MRLAATPIGSLLLLVTLNQGIAEEPVAQTDPADFAENVRPFLAANCLDCHTGADAEAEFRLDDVDGVVTSGRDTERWEKTLEMLSVGAMPPEEADQPTKHDRRRIEAWITAELRKIGRGPDPARLARPEFGNRVDHDDLFSGQYTGPAYSPSRLWRKNPQIHDRFERTLRVKPGNSPFSAKGGRGFQDYAMLVADKSTIESLRINAKNYVAEILDGRLVNPKGPDGKPDKSRLVREGRSRWGEFNDLVQAADDPTEEQRTKAVRRAFELLLDRPATDEEVARYDCFLVRAIEIGGPKPALDAMLQAVILSPEFVYRQEIGLGPELPDGRRMLSPHEISYAIAYALTDSPPDDELWKAVREERLATKEDVEREVRRMLATSTRTYWDYEINHTFQSHVEACPNPRVLRFFREFFGYGRVFDVFKDKTRNADHKPQFLFKDADLFVLAILDEDRDVLRQLLTSDRYMVHYVSLEKGQQKLERMRRDAKKNARALEILASGRTPVLGGYRGGNYMTAYGLDKETWDYPLDQPFLVEHRTGMLTHPAWLVAHSGNFDTDPIRRGKWIREHLLAGVIPEIPIGVDAAVDDDPHRTIRERIEKTTAAKCWRCHKAMNPLGLPFESFDDFGRFREKVYYDPDGKVVPTYFERVQLVKSAKQRKQPDLTFTTKPLDTTGTLTGTGNPALDGDVTDAFELVERLAESERVRQSFVRHAFRYWTGRNETLDDSPTLMAADAAYVDSGGSFEELLVSLLTSDSFLMRKDF